MAPTNNAAWIPAAKAHPMEVGPAEYPTVGAGELIIKAAAIAINPMDWFIQIMGNQLFSFLKYPYCGGDDVAGTVAEVGSGVDNFKVGDRVVGIAPGFGAREGAFQEYVVVKAAVTSPIPASVTFEQASVLPLGICSAAAGLYQETYLNLDPPSLDPKPKDETLLIWAGASSVGTNAIQLAVASGYEVFTTSSPKNFEYCKSLGASKVFDYRSPTIAADLIAAFQGKKCRGAFAIQRGAEVPCFEIIAKVEGTKFISCAMPIVPDKVPQGLSAKFINASAVAAPNEVGEMIWTKFLPAALEQGKYKCLPEPLVVGQGLEKLQEAMDKGKVGAKSAQKLVVTL
jgi:NADPH:quinone reductase-like Zn-dependent oxidoreductase